jgi:threonine aldolase
MTKTRQRHELASDNTAGVCPESLAEIERANTDAAPAYGEDVWTKRVCDRIREIFEIDCDIYLVFNGTAANALALAQLCQSYQSLICHKLAHIQTDECGAPEFFTKGSRLLPVDGAEGKIALGQAEAILAEQHELHSHKPRVISITQATEVGTVYKPGEIAAVSKFAKARDLLVQMDGARFANAVASLNCAPKDITWKLGIDVLCFGGTKNGTLAGELVIFFRRDLSRDFDYRAKQAGQLGSKMRFLAAGWMGLLTNDTWSRNAAYANNIARKLSERLRAETKLDPVFPVESNAVFLRLNDPLVAGVQALGWNFYKFIEPDIYRLMCSWETTEETVEEFVADVKRAIRAE